MTKKPIFFPSDELRLLVQLKKKREPAILKMTSLYSLYADDVFFKSSSNFWPSYIAVKCEWMAAAAAEPNVVSD